jgi:hypothetical protein
LKVKPFLVDLSSVLDLDQQKVCRLDLDPAHAKLFREPKAKAPFKQIITKINTESRIWHCKICRELTVQDVVLVVDQLYFLRFLDFCKIWISISIEIFAGLRSAKTNAIRKIDPEKIYSSNMFFLTMLSMVFKITWDQNRYIRNEK